MTIVHFFYTLLSNFLTLFTWGPFLSYIQWVKKQGTGGFMRIPRFLSILGYKLSCLLLRRHHELNLVASIVNQAGKLGN